MEAFEDHAAKPMTRYAGKIDTWDVLNEFIEVPKPGYRVTDLTRVLGADFPERLFKLAAELDPKAKMTYNDLSAEKPDRLKAILAFVRKLRDKGCKIDIIGSQPRLELPAAPARRKAAAVEPVCLAGFLRLMKRPLPDAFPQTAFSTSLPHGSRFPAIPLPDHPGGNRKPQCRPWKCSAVNRDGLCCLKRCSLWA